MKKSLEPLAKSQLLSLRGETVALVEGRSEASPAVLLKHYAVGSVIDQKYKIVSLLGEGGMGAVYKAHHLGLGKEVALKTFRSPDMDADYLKRFQREAQAIGLLQHPNIVQVFDYGLGENNLPYYTMECLVGETLADRLSEREFLPLDQALPIFIQICQGLLVAHRKGIIHRDLKPGNIFLEKSQSGDPLYPRVKIVDFGLAGWASQSLEGQKLTSTGTIFGSPLYMSPEQSMGEEMSASSDIYSCGCALYETLTGAPPFKGETAFATMLKHQTDPVPELNNPFGEKVFPMRLKSLVERMLAKDQNKRIQTFEHVAAELEAILHSVPDKEAIDDAAAEERFDPQDRYRPKRSPIKVAIIAACIVMSVAALSVILSSRHAYQPKPFTVASADHESPFLMTLIPEEKSVQAPTPGKDDKIAPYLQETELGGPGWRQFRFPNNISLGRLEWIYERKFQRGAAATSILPALGDITVPPHTLLRLTPSQDLMKAPWLFNGFGADDLNHIEMPADGVDCNDEDVKYISRLTGLHDLVLNETAITNKCIADLDKLENLRLLQIRTTALSGPEVAKLRILPRLHKFAATGMHDAGLVLQRMKNNKNLIELIVNSCYLNDADLEVLPTMSKIRVLYLFGNNRITDKSIQKIAQLNDLQELYIGGTAISPASANTLKTMTKLKKLSVDWDLWPAEELNRLKKAMPGCFVTKKAAVDSRKNDAAEIGSELGP